MTALIPATAAAGATAPRNRQRTRRRKSLSTNDATTATTMRVRQRLPLLSFLALIVVLTSLAAVSRCEGALPQQQAVEVDASTGEGILIEDEVRSEQCDQSSASSEEGGGRSSSKRASTSTDVDSDNNDDASWEAQQLWNGSRDLFQGIFGTTEKDDEEGGGSSSYDPFQELAEGRHGNAEAEPGFFESLWDPTDDADTATDPQQRSPSVIFQAFQKMWGGRAEDETTNDSESQTTGSAWEEALLTRFKTSQETVLEESVGIKKERFQKVWGEMSAQLRNTFTNVPIDKLNPLQIWYAMQYEESVKDPVWKRRQHRALPELKEKEAVALFDGMYLSYLSYVESCQDVEEGLRNFDNASWVLVNCTTAGQPLRPAHFLAVKRQQGQPPSEQRQQQGWQWWGGDAVKRRELEVVLVIRGTKELGDALSDALLEPAPYRDGHAHDGILKSARWIHETYKDWIRHLQQVSQSTHVKLWLVGHSLGAGTAALASMEFNGAGEVGADNDSEASTAKIDGWEAHALGFGTPSVLSQELSESVQQYITTVINDADCVPRMSGATLANGLLRILQYNWTDDALDDLRDAMVAFKEGAPQSIAENFMPESAADAFLGWVASVLRSMTKDLPVVDATMLSQPVLFPPGDCVHLYRDGVDWKGTYVPCRRFNQLEMVRTLVDDHLIDTGYYVGLLGFVRALRKDLNWQFAHDLLKLPVR